MPELSPAASYPRLLRLGGRRWLKLFVPLIALRLAALVWGVVNVDETTFFVFARMVRAGALPYVSAVDNKPVLAYLAFLPGAFAGWRLWPLQWMGLAWIFATAWVVGKVVEGWLGFGGDPGPILRPLSGAERGAQACSCRSPRSGPSTGRKTGLPRPWILSMSAPFRPGKGTEDRSRIATTALSERAFSAREAGWTAAWLTVVITCCSVPALSTELLFNLPIAASLLFAVRRGRGWSDFAAGVCVALASLIKHQAGITLVALAIAVLLDAPLPLTTRLRRCVVLGVGFVVPWALVAGVYVGIGQWAAFFEWNVTRNFAYSAHDPTSPLRLLGEGIGVAILLAAPVAWVLAGRSIPRAWRNSFGRAVVLLFGLTWIAVGMGGRFYLHYFLQFVVPLAVLAAPEATELLMTWSSRARATRWLVTVGVALPMLFWLVYGPARGALHGLPAQEPRAVAMADWIRTHSTPEERVFLWGSYSPVYYLAERLPGTRYLDASVLAGNFDPSHVPEGFDLKPYQSARDVDQTVVDLETNRTALFVDTAPADLHDWRHFPLADFPKLDSYVRQHYTLAGQAAGALIYRRNATGTDAPLTRTH